LKHVVCRNYCFHQSHYGFVGDDAYRLVQNQIADNPLIGDLVVGGAGIRKLRFAQAGRGMSASGRLIY
jgi:hypothetical protein